MLNDSHPGVREAAILCIEVSKIYGLAWCNILMYFVVILLNLKVVSYLSELYNVTQLFMFRWHYWSYRRKTFNFYHLALVSLDSNIRIVSSSGNPIFHIIKIFFLLESLLSVSLNSLHAERLADILLKSILMFSM